ncbi:TPA: hypothetical protein N0F65_002486, partial [Lagenidium giganteum]
HHIIYADNHCGQNKNNTVIKFLRFLTHAKHIKKVSLNFSLKGTPRTIVIEDLATSSVSMRTQMCGHCGSWWTSLETRRHPTRQCYSKIPNAFDHFETHSTRRTRISVD